MNEMISVIVPVYNVAPYLEKCVNSIIAQTYTNLEIILVDDGSTDGSAAMCDELANKDNRIVVIHQKNNGVSAARNVGLANALGQYISFVDADDYISPIMIASIYNSLKAADADISICSFDYVDCIDDEKHIVQSPVKDEVISGRQLISEKMFNDSYKTIFWSALWNKLFKKQLFDGVVFPDIVVYEDLFVLPEIFEKCQRIACISSNLYYYVQHSKSVLHTTGFKDLEGALVYFHLANVFSGKKEYIKIYIKMLFSGIAFYRKASSNNNVRKEKRCLYKDRKKKAVVLFRSAWKTGRGLARRPFKKFVFFEIFYVSMNLGLAMYGLMKKMGRL